MNRQQKLQCTDAGNKRIKIKKKMIKIQKGKIGIIGKIVSRQSK